MIERPDETVVKKLSSALAIPPVHAKLLASRGITDPEDAKSFFHLYESARTDPYLIYDMEKSVTIITNSIEDIERDVIYGNK